MDYITLAETYEKIEATSKRLEMTEILVELFTLVKEKERGILDKVVYLTQGRLFEIRSEEESDKKYTAVCPACGHKHQLAKKTKNMNRESCGHCSNVYDKNKKLVYVKNW